MVEKGYCLTIWQQSKQMMQDSFSNTFSKDNFMQGGLNGALNAAGSMVGGLIGGGLESGAGKIMSGLGSVVSNIPGPIGAIGGAALQVVGGLTNKMFGAKFNEENIAEVNQNINALNSFQSNASSYDDLASNWSNATQGMTFDKNFIGSDGWFSNKVGAKYDKLQEQVAQGKGWVANSLRNNQMNMKENELASLLKGQFAWGGVLPGYGADFTNNLVFVDEGGTHAENPLGGVPMGVDAEGTPNLVEEGEVIYNGYVYSNKLKLTHKMKKELGLTGDLTFAAAVRKLARESEERPNDPISKRTLNTQLENLIAKQEQLKAAKASKQAPGANVLEGGGGLNIDFNYQQPVFNPSSTFNWMHSPIGQAITGIMPDKLPDVNFTSELPSFNHTPKTLGDTIKSFFPTPGVQKKQVPAYTPTEETGEKKTVPQLNVMPRYAGLAGSFLEMAKDSLGLQNQGDYTAANNMMAAINNQSTPTIGFSPLKGKLGPMYIDTRAQANALNAQSGATRRQLRNSGLSKGQLMGSYISQDYANNNALGEALRQAIVSQQGIDTNILTFNQNTDKYNIEGARATALANAQNQAAAQSRYIEGLSKALALREQERNAVDAAKSNNKSVFFNALQSLGDENMRFNLANQNPAMYYAYNPFTGWTYKGNDGSTSTEESVAPGAKKKTKSNKTSV
jgi:hypothetical protein